MAYHFGRHAAPGPLLVTNVVAGAPALGDRAEAPRAARRPPVRHSCATWAGPASDITARAAGDDVALDGIDLARRSQRVTLAGVQVGTQARVGPLGQGFEQEAELRMHVEAMEAIAGPR